MKIKTPKYKYKNTFLIDDNDLDNFINEKMLQASHFSQNIYVKKSGETALSAIVNIRDIETCPEIMFVDLNMPVMNGFEFINKFRELKDEKLLKCKIVILTSSIYNEDRIIAEKIDREIVFVNKPLTIEILNKL